MEKLGDDEDMDVRAGENGAEEANLWSEIRMPFVNENLAVLGKDEDGKETVSQHSHETGIAACLITLIRVTGSCHRS